MRISLIAAMTKDRVIGVNNKMPWYIKEEMQHFKKTTMGKPIIMGSKTFDALGQKILPGRKNIILSSSKNLQGTDYIVASDVKQALQAAGKAEEIMVIGGAIVYRQFLPLADKIYLSIVDVPIDIPGDSHFPEVDLQQWNIVSEQHYAEFILKIMERRGNMDAISSNNFT